MNLEKYITPVTKITIDDLKGLGLMAEDKNKEQLTVNSDAFKGKSGYVLDPRYLFTVPSPLPEYTNLWMGKINYAPPARTNFPKVTDVQTFNEKVTKVFFSDGTMETAIRADGDPFTIELGITICIMKRLLRTTKDNGTKQYNKMIDQALKAKKQHEQLKAREVKREEEEKKIAQNKERKRKAKVEKRRKQRVQDIRTAIALSKRDDIAKVLDSIKSEK